MSGRAPHAFLLVVLPPPCDWAGRAPLSPLFCTRCCPKPAAAFGRCACKGCSSRGLLRGRCRLLLLHALPLPRLPTPSPPSSSPRSFAYPAAREGVPDAALQAMDFQAVTIQRLRDVGVDAYMAGWYQSTYLGSYCSRDTVEAQLDFQEELPNSVLIIYDHVRTAQGQLSLRALRLTDAFMAAYGGGRAPSAEVLATLSPSQIFEELPIRIRNPPLVQALLTDLHDLHGIAGAKAPAAASFAAPAAASAVATGTAASAAAAASSSGTEDVDFCRLDLNPGPYLEKHLKFMHNIADELVRAQVDQSMVARRLEEQRKRQADFIAARRKENEDRKARGLEPLPETDPSHPAFQPLRDQRAKADPLDTMLLSAQISNYCQQVSKYAGASFGKLFLAGSLHK